MPSFISGCENNAHIRGIPKNIETNVTGVGNVGTGLDSLHSFTLPADSLAKDKDYLRVRYAGTFATNDNDKRIVISFGGQTVHDPGLFDQDTGSWTYDIVYVRRNSTTVIFSLLAVWFAAVINDGVPAALDSIILGLCGTLTVSNLNTNAITMLVQAEGTANNDVVQEISVIDLTAS